MYGVMESLSSPEAAVKGGTQSQYSLRLHKNLLRTLTLLNDGRPVAHLLDHPSDVDAGPNLAALGGEDGERHVAREAVKQDELGWRKVAR